MPTSTEGDGVFGTTNRARLSKILADHSARVLSVPWKVATLCVSINFIIFLGGFCRALLDGVLGYSRDGWDVVIRTYSAKPSDIKRQWWLFDANEQIVGRLATKIAVILMGKHRPIYTPHIDTGDFVIVTNVEKIVFSGKKWDQKVYTRYTGWPGLRTETAGDRRDRHPDRILSEAVRRMLPKNKLGRQMLSKLKIYVGDEHPHQAQNPQTPV